MLILNQPNPTPQQSKNTAETISLPLPLHILHPSNKQIIQPSLYPSIRPSMPPFIKKSLIINYIFYCISMERTRKSAKLARFDQETLDCIAREEGENGGNSGGLFKRIKVSVPDRSKVEIDGTGNANGDGGNQDGKQVEAGKQEEFKFAPLRVPEPGLFANNFVEIGKRNRPSQSQIPLTNKKPAPSIFQHHQRQPDSHIPSYSSHTNPYTGNPASQNALIEQLLFRMSRIQVKNYQLAAQVRMLKSERNQYLQQLSKRPSKQQLTQLQTQLAQLKSTLTKPPKQKQPQKQQAPGLFSTSTSTPSTFLKKQPKYNFDSQNVQSNQILERLRYQHESIQDQSQRIGKLEKAVKDGEVTLDGVNQRLEDIEDCFKEKMDQFFRKRDGVVDDDADDTKQKQDNKLDFFDKVQQSIFGTAQKSTSKFNYIQDCQIIFRQSLSKFKKDDGQMLQNMRVQIEQNFNKTLTWLNIKTAQTKIHKETGILMKGKSEMKKFSGKDNNVMISVYGRNGDKFVRSVFKLQFQSCAGANQFMQVVDGLIK